MLKKDREWFCVEVRDHDGQIVSIEPGMLSGRDIGEVERAKIHEAIQHLIGFVGQENTEADPWCDDCRGWQCICS